jgi:protein-S-isoprenylcysteine O-methyltransferase Ste14
MYQLLFLAIYTMVYYFITSKKTKHLDQTKETIQMFRTDAPTSIYISVFFIIILSSLINFVFFTNFMKFYLIDILGVILIICSGIIEYNAIISLKENYYPQTGKEKNLIINGIFKYIRHPIYLSGLFLGLGILIFFAKNIWYYLYPIMVIAIIYKIESEEKYLLKRFKTYKAYQKKSYKIIPYIY